MITYVSNQGIYQLEIPADWETFPKDGENETSLSKRAGESAVTVSAFQADDPNSRANACAQLRGFLSANDVRNAKYHHCSENRAVVSYRDEEDDCWVVQMISSGPYLVLASLNGSQSLSGSGEWNEGISILESIIIIGDSRGRPSK